METLQSTSNGKPRCHSTHPCKLSNHQFSFTVRCPKELITIISVSCHSSSSCLPPPPLCNQHSTGIICFRLSSPNCRPTNLPISHFCSKPSNLGSFASAPLPSAEYCLIWTDCVDSLPFFLPLAYSLRICGVSLTSFSPVCPANRLISFN